MKVKRFNDLNESFFNKRKLPKNTEVHISGIKCDNCNWKDMSVPFEDYEQWINKPCPKCGENLLTQKDYDECLEIMNASEIINKYSKEDLEKIVANLSPEEMDSVLDTINNLGLKNKGVDKDGKIIWST